MPDKNHRTDEYGGSLDNRCRLGVRIVERIREVAGEDLLILYRHTPTGDRYGIDDSLHLADRLVDAGANILDISPAREASVADLASPFAARFSIPVMAVGGMEDPEAASAALREGKCDLIAIGRQMIADHLWTVAELLLFRVPLPRWTPPKRRGKPSKATKALIAQWCW